MYRAVSEKTRGNMAYNKMKTFSRLRTQILVIWQFLASEMLT